MNDLMSFGTHHLWKRFAIELSSVRNGSNVLDVATGTGDILNKIKNINCFSVGIDQNFDILNLAKNKLINNCVIPNLVNGNSEICHSNQTYLIWSLHRLDLEILQINLQH